MSFNFLHIIQYVYITYYIFFIFLRTTVALSKKNEGEIQHFKGTHILVKFQHTYFIFFRQPARCSQLLDHECWSASKSNVSF